MVIIIFIFTGGLLSISMMPHIGWLNSTVAGLGNHPGGADLICNKATCGLALLNTFWVFALWVECMLLHIHHLMLVGWLYCFLCIPFLENSLEVSEIKLPPACGSIFLVNPYSEKKLNMLVLDCLLKDLHLFDYWELAIIIHSNKVIFVTQREHFCTNNFPWSFWKFMLD